MPRPAIPLRTALPMLLPLALAACGGGSGGARLSQSSYGRFYTAPGPPEDPWRPFIVEASARFSVPQGWIRAVIRQESGGHEYLHGRPVTSDAGAMGLMQLMPATYAELRDRYGLGNDPYDPHDNIIAGTGYISELYARYGAPAFLVAYDAGPRRMDEYNAGRGTLPNETVAYLASVAPALAAEGPMTGPLAAYADAGGAPRAPVQVYAAYARPLGGCWRDPDAAYDPDDKCNRATPPAAAPLQTAQAGGGTAAGSVLWGSGGGTPATPVSAPIPTQPGHYRPQPYQAPTYRPPAYAIATPRPSRFGLIASAQAEPMRISPADARWGVQVGAFANPVQARQVADSARRVAPEQLARAQTILGTTTPFGGQVLYRARLIGITHPAADTACGRLSAQRLACLTVPPGG
jgi:D-alanyl-D-alanine carboxypeptidase